MGTDGKVYVVGKTSSTNLPTANPYQAGYGGGDYDILAFSLDSSGSALLYSTYLGGSNDDYARGVCLNTDG